MTKEICISTYFFFVIKFTYKPFIELRKALNHVLWIGKANGVIKVNQKIRSSHEKMQKMIFKETFPS